MDLRKFYLDNVSKQEYYYKFYELINDINKSYNVFEGVVETDNYDFSVFDLEEAIEKFRYLCQPENELHDDENKCWFYLILFYLNKNGYIIREFPKLVERPPENTYEFVNRQIRNKIISQSDNFDGTVTWKERRIFVSKLMFVQDERYVEITADIEAKFKEISNRQASFEDMSTDEKLAEIANLVEYLLKKDGKFLLLDYSQICFAYINDDVIKIYRHQLQCFRHSSPEAIIERSTFTEEQKIFLIDFGLSMLKVIHSLRNTVI